MFPTKNLARKGLINEQNLVTTSLVIYNYNGEIGPNNNKEANGLPTPRPPDRTMYRMLTSLNRNIFRLTGPLWGEFNGPTVDFLWNR